MEKSNVTVTAFEWYLACNCQMLIEDMIGIDTLKEQMELSFYGAADKKSIVDRIRYLIEQAVK